MRLTRNNAKLSAFTSTDLLMVIGVVSILAGIFAIWTIRTKRTKLLATCIDNQKQIVLSFKMFTGDSANEFPVEFFTGGRGRSYPSNSNRGVWEYLCLVSNELGTAKVLICPQDIARRTNWAIGFSSNANGLQHPSQQNNSISYFIGMGATEINPNTLAVGDRNLAADNTSPLYSSSNSGSVQISLQSTWRSSANQPFHGDKGTYGLADGSVQMLTDTTRLQEALRLSRQSYGTNANRFLFPQ